MNEAERENIVTAYFDVVATRDLMAAIDTEFADDKVDKDVFRVCANSLRRAIELMHEVIEANT